MTQYTWPGWKVNRFEMRVIPNTRSFTGPYTPNVQTLDFFGERWSIRAAIVPTNDPIQTAEREAFWDRLKGMANTVALWHLKIKAPQGTMRDGATIGITNTAGQALNLVNTSGQALGLISGTPTLGAAVAQFANTCTLRCAPGKTLRAGDMVGIAGQLVRIMADATADGSGNLAIEFQPRARAAWPIYSAVVWNAPTANFMLKAGDGVPTSWVPGAADGADVEFIEAL